MDNVNPVHELAGTSVLAHRAELAATLVDREFSRHPDLASRYGATARAKSLQDVDFHLASLAQALSLNDRALFADYVGWAKVMLARRNVLTSDLAFHLECLAEVLREQLPADQGSMASEFVTAAVETMPRMPDDLPTFLRDGEPLSPLAHQYFEALRRGERQVAARLVLDAVEAGAAVRDIYLHVFQPAQFEIGRLWQTNQISVAQEHYCSAATQLIMSQLYPHIFASERIGRRLVATCVAGDLHEIGVRMVADFFEMEGWDTFYLGANTPHDSVVETIVERAADVLAISATIAYHVESVRQLIATVRRHPVAGRVAILVGGYPFNRSPELWRDLGADGSAGDAQHAIAMATRLWKTRST